MRYYAICLLVLSVLVCSAANAEMYKWVDKNGDIHVTDTMPAGSESGSGTKIETIKGPSNEVEEPIPQRAVSPEIRKNTAAASNMYTESQRSADMQKTEERINRFRTTCKTDKHTNGKDQEWWNNYCDVLANDAQKTLDVLTNEPDRYYYVIDQQLKKARGEAVDPYPLYRHWN